MGLLLMGYNGLAVLTILALMQSDQEFYGATPFQWVGAVGIAGLTLAAVLFYWFRVKDPRDYKDNKEEIQRLLAQGDARVKTVEGFLEKQEARFASEMALVRDQHRADMDRAHDTFRSTMESTLARVDIYNKGLTDLRTEMRDIAHSFRHQ